MTAKRKPAPGSPLRFFVYARVSSEEQRERHTIDSQLDVLPSWIASQNGVIVETYIDDGHSGETIEDRPDFVRLLAAMAAGKGDAVATVDYDRITRSQSDEIRGRISDTFRQTGVLWGSPNTGLRDFGDDSQRIIMGVEGSMSATEKAKFLRRTSRGKHSWAYKGLFRAGIDPYGYRWIADSKAGKGHYEIREDEAKLVRHMYQLALTTGTNMVAWKLNQEGRRTRPMKRRSRPNGEPGPWAVSTVGKILKSPTYKGAKSVFEGVMVDVDGTQKPVPPMTVPAIIDPETWQRVQAGLAHRKPIIRHASDRQYLLSGFAKCGVCGYACWVVGTRSGLRRYSYYRCSSSNAWRRMGMEGPCGLPHLRVAQVDECVWAKVVEVLSHPKLLAQACSIADLPTGINWASQLSALKKTLRRLEKLELEALANRRRGNLSAKACEQELREIARERKLFEHSKRMAEQQMAAAGAKRQLSNDLHKAVSELAHTAERATFEERQQVLRLLVSTELGGKVVLNLDGSIEMQGTFSA